MRKTRLVAISAVLGLALSGSAAVAGATPADDAGPSLVRALAHLSGDADLAVEQEGRRVVVRDRASGDAVLIASDRHVTLGTPDKAQAPTRAGTRVVRDARGAALYTASTTRLGARSAVFPAGRLLAGGLHVLVFDNDDVHVSDGDGRVVFSSATDEDGTLVERVDARYGCGCERVTAPDGRVVVRPLAR